VENLQQSQMMMEETKGATPAGLSRSRKTLPPGLARVRARATEVTATAMTVSAISQVSPVTRTGAGGKMVAEERRKKPRWRCSER
jgi:hypothetical protein